MRTEQPPLEVREKILKSLSPEKQAAEARRVAAVPLQEKIASLRAEQRNLYDKERLSEERAQKIAEIDAQLQSLQAELKTVLSN